MNPDNNIKRNFLCWLIGHKKHLVCTRCWAITDPSFADLFVDALGWNNPPEVWK